jgi:hypothetical protein
LQHKHCFDMLQPTCSGAGMKHLAIVVVVIGLTGCKPAPSNEKVAAEAKERLQAQLDHDHAGSHLSVQKIEVVKLSAPKYEGDATIEANGTTFDIPVAVTSDGETTIVAVDDQKLNAELLSSLQHRLAVLGTKYSDYVLTPTIFEIFPAYLKAAKTDFADRLQVIGPIASDQEFYFGSGCMAHQCGSDGAAWSINKKTG